MAEKTINLRGLKCPLPALRARKALTGLKAGDVLIAECTDPLTAIDIPNLLSQTGDALEFELARRRRSDFSHPEELTRLTLTSRAGPPSRSPASSARSRPR